MAKVFVAVVEGVNDVDGGDGRGVVDFSGVREGVGFAECWVGVVDFEVFFDEGVVLVEVG